MKMFYYTYVRSKWEYGAIIWNALYNSHNALIEPIQKSFSNIWLLKRMAVILKEAQTHELLLTRFHIDSLTFRYKCMSLKMLYKLVFNKIACSQLLAQINFPIPSVDLRVNNDFYPFKVNTNITLKSPVYVMCGLFYEIVTSNFLGKGKLYI